MPSALAASEAPRQSSRSLWGDVDARSIRSPIQVVGSRGRKLAGHRRGATGCAPLCCGWPVQVQVNLRIRTPSLGGRRYPPLMRAWVGPTACLRSRSGSAAVRGGRGRSVDHGRAIVSVTGACVAEADFFATRGRALRRRPNWVREWTPPKPQRISAADRRHDRPLSMFRRRLDHTHAGRSSRLDLAGRRWRGRLWLCAGWIPSVPQTKPLAGASEGASSSSGVSPWRARPLEPSRGVPSRVCRRAARVRDRVSVLEQRCADEVEAVSW